LARAATPRHNHRKRIAGSATDAHIAGYKLVMKAIQAPFLSICKNSGVEGKPLLAKILEDDDFNIGYNARTGVIEDLVESGVIDPVKVVKASLINAASAAGILLTTECLIHEVVVKKEEKQT